MPGKQDYISMQHFRHPDWPGEEEIHQTTIDSIPYSRSQARSLFIDNASYGRALKQVQENLIANADLTREEIARMLQRTAKKVDDEIARNIERNPHLRRAYDRMLSRGAAPMARTAENGS